MLEKLVALANKFDAAGFYLEADVLDYIIRAEVEKEPIIRRIKLPELVENLKALKENILQIESEMKATNDEGELSLLKDELNKYKNDFGRNMKYLEILQTQKPDLFSKFQDIDKMTPEQIHKKYYANKKIDEEPAVIEHKIYPD